MPPIFGYSGDCKQCVSVRRSSRPVGWAVYSPALLFLVTCVSVFAQGCSSASAGVAARYIEALQKRDYKTVIDLSSNYQSQVFKMKTDNPETLWGKLIKEYYDTKISALEGKPGYWQSYGEALSGAMGDPAQQIRQTQGLIPPGAKWKITETREGSDRTIVYVSVSYPSLDESPFVDGKFLKATILEFDVDPALRLVTGLGRLSQGDTQWDAPLMILNATWRGDRFSGGYISAQAVGGTAPFSWVPQCGSVELAKGLAQYDGFGRPLDPHTSHLVVRFRSFADKMFPLQCVIAVTDGKGQTNTVGVTVPKMFTGFNEYCWIRPPWFSRGQGLPSSGNIQCLDPVLAIDTAAVAPAVSPVQSAPSADPTAAKGHEVLDEMVAGQFGKIEEQYDSAMKAAMPPGKLRDFWKQLLAQAGRFRGVTSERSRTQQPYQVATLVCAFQRATFDAEFAFDADGTIGGIHFLPHKKVRP